MKKALFVGINDYQHVSKLSGCINDAIAMSSVLSRHGNGSPNFSTKVMLSSDITVSRELLLEKIQELFSGDCDAALLYFAGHGIFDESIDEGMIAPQDYKAGNGVRVSDIMQFAAKAGKIKNKIIILDCCQSGGAGESNVLKAGASILSEGVTILTACKKDEYAMEAKNGHGVFTSLLLQALHGGAANILGDITPGSLYSFVDGALGAWEQRPVFKTNVSGFCSLREMPPKIELAILRNLPEWFPEAESTFALDPSFEPTEATTKKECAEIFSKLQKCSRHGLIEPVEAEHMYYAAINSTGCRLTALGAYYRELALKNQI